MINWLSINSTEIITCLITVLGSFLTVFLTIRNTNIIHNKSLEEQNKQFETTLKENRKDIEKSFNYENQKNAIPIKPYFKLEKIEYKQEKIGQLNRFLFDAYINNVGNGTAINLSLKSNKELSIYEREFPSKLRYIAYGPVSDEIVKVDSDVTFSFSCEIHEDIGERVYFEVFFEDLMGREYKQGFCFYYKTYDYKIDRLETYKSELINDIKYSDE